jgi:hypothetical protein
MLISSRSFSVYQWQPHGTSDYVPRLWELAMRSVSVTARLGTSVYSTEVQYHHIKSHRTPF